MVFGRHAQTFVAKTAERSRLSDFRGARMSCRIYNIHLECGCLVCEDPENPGIIDCYAEWGDLKTKKGKAKLDLHNKCWEEYFLKRRNRR